MCRLAPLLRLGLTLHPTSHSARGLNLLLLDLQSHADALCLTYALESPSAFAPVGPTIRYFASRVRTGLFDSPSFFRFGARAPSLALGRVCSPGLGAARYLVARRSRALCTLGNSPSRRISRARAHVRLKRLVVRTRTRYRRVALFFTVSQDGIWSFFIEICSHGGADFFEYAGCGRRFIEIRRGPRSPSDLRTAGAPIPAG